MEAMSAHNPGSQRRIVGFSGNWSRPSRTRTLVRSVLETVAARDLGQTALYDLIDVGPSLGATFIRTSAAPALNAVMAAIESADALVVGTAVYKGAYTGLFKHFFDLFEREAFAGKPVLIAATGAAPAHQSVLDYHLRPLFLFFDARVASRGLYGLGDDFESPEVLKASYMKQVEHSVSELDEMLRRSIIH